MNPLRVIDSITGALKHLTLAGLVLAVSTTARAGLVVYEGFNYPGQADNAVLGAAFNGGTGLSGNWQGNGKYRTTGLTFSDLAVAGGCAQGLTAGVNDGQLDDPDHDGIANLLEFALGGAPMVSSQSVMPKFAEDGGAWVFEYDRSDISMAPATTQIVEYGSNLMGWTPVTIPATSAGIVEVTPGSPTDHVKVTIPSGGSDKFVRLKVIQ